MPQRVLVLNCRFYEKCHMHLFLLSNPLNVAIIKCTFMYFLKMYCRLPVYQGPTVAYTVPLLVISSLPDRKCPPIDYSVIFNTTTGKYPCKMRLADRPCPLNVRRATSSLWLYVILMK